MSHLLIDGSYSLEGEITPSGSKDSAAKLLIASLFSNEEIVLDNISQNYLTHHLIPVIESIGTKVEWIGKHKLSINASGIYTHEIPYDVGSRLRTTTLLAGPLLYRFGKAVLPKPHNAIYHPAPINRWVDTWQALGITVESDEHNLILSVNEPNPANINFKINTHNGTANAIMSSVFCPGESIISNAAEEDEVTDLIAFFNTIGANIERIEPRKLRVIGTNVFRGGYFEAQPDKIEAVAYITAGIITKGNITVKGIERLELAAFLNFLTKVGVRYEYSKSSLNVWYGGEEYLACNQNAAPSPGFLADWIPFASLILNLASGTSLLHDTIYIDRLNFVKDLNRMGARMELMRPSDVGIQGMISDESYDYTTHGEPYTVAKIEGPSKLRGARLNMSDPRFDTCLVVAALGAEGKSQLLDVDTMHIRHEDFFDKLNSLGAHIT